MFLHFHRKYNMILFVLHILDHIQIKTLNSFFFCLFFYNSITYIKKQTHTHLFFTIFSPTFTCYKSQKFKINQTTHYTIQKLHNSPYKSRKLLGRLLYHKKKVVARLLHAPLPLAVRGFTRHHEEEPGNSGI
jgi:hypothetical protein